MISEALIAGLWSSVGSALGKVAGSASIVGDSIIIWIIIITTMVLVNTWGNRCYLRALDSSSNSATPTVVSAASSYVLSGAIGILLFKESASIKWWIGALLIVLGLIVMSRKKLKAKKE